MHAFLARPEIYNIGAAWLLQVAWVPGSFELPLLAAAMAKSGKYDAVVTVGAVVRF